MVKKKNENLSEHNKPKANKKKLGNKSKKDLVFNNVYITIELLKQLDFYFTNPSAKAISAMLNDRTRRIESNVTSYRQINSWDKYGLLDIERKGTEWRKYSIMDFLWLNIIYELRGFGYTREQIKKVKESLSKDAEIVKVAMPMLEFCVNLALSPERVPIVLIVFSDGSALPLPYEEYKTNILYGLKNHIYIDVNEILQRTFAFSDVRPLYNLNFHLTKEEAKLFSFIRCGNYEKIEVKFKNKKMEIIEGTERINANKRIVDILKEQKYQSIEVIKKDDVIVSIVRKTKKKISNED